MKANPEAHEAAPHGEAFDEDCLHVSSIANVAFFLTFGDVHLQAMWHEIHSDWPEHVGAS